MMKHWNDIDKWWREI